MEVRVLTVPCWPAEMRESRWSSAGVQCFDEVVPGIPVWIGGAFKCMPNELSLNIIEPAEFRGIGATTEALNKVVEVEAALTEVQPTWSESLQVALHVLEFAGVIHF